MTASMLINSGHGIIRKYLIAGMLALFLVGEIYHAAFGTVKF
jgi:hypothetical protein